MSHRPIWDKKVARVEGRQRQRAAAKKIHHGGVLVSKRDVMRHRYLREHGLPFSQRVASVLILKAA